MRDPDAAVRELAVAALGGFGVEGVEQLRRNLLAHLVTELDRPQEAVRRRAALALKAQAPEYRFATTSTRERLVARDADLSRLAEEILAQPAAAGLGPIGEALVAPDVVARLSAILALGGAERHAAFAAALLAPVVLREAGYLGEVALESLARLGRAGDQALLGVLRAELGHAEAPRREAALARTAGLGPRAAGVGDAVLGLALRDPEATVRTSAARALGALVTEAKAPALDAAGKRKAAAAVQDTVAKDALIRARGARALGELGAAAAPHAELLTRLLGDGGNVVRMRAAEALGRIGPASQAAIPRLLQQATDKNPAVAREADMALRRTCGITDPPASRR